MNTGIEFAEKLSKAYSETCKPLCHELNIHLTFPGEQPRIQNCQRHRRNTKN